MARADQCGGYRMVVRFRLFPRRPLLDRLRLSGRRADLRLAAPVCRHRPAGRACDLHRHRGHARTPVMDARCAPPPRPCGCAHRIGMAARARPHRISLERAWLRADLAAGAGAECGADRHMGSHLSGGRDLRQSGDAVRRPQRKPLAAAAADAGGRRARCASRATARCGSRARRRSLSPACICASCSRTCSRTCASTMRPSSKCWTATSLCRRVPQRRPAVAATSRI